MLPTRDLFFALKLFQNRLIKTVSDVSCLPVGWRYALAASLSKLSLKFTLDILHHSISVVAVAREPPLVGEDVMRSRKLVYCNFKELSSQSSTKFERLALERSSAQFASLGDKLCSVGTDCNPMFFRDMVISWNNPPT